MDPISIATAAGTASKTLYSISTTLYTFISSAKKVDKSLEAFHNEVNAMARALDSVQSVLKQPLILRTQAEIPGVDHVWTSTASAIRDTQNTARILQELVKGLGTLDASPNVFRKANMQLKINFNSEDINRVRTLCQSHFNSLNVSLHLVTMLIHCQSHDDSKIFSELNDLRRLVKDGQLDSTPEQFHALEAKLPYELKNPDMLLHTEQLELAVQSVIYVASSVIDSQSAIGTGISEIDPDWFTYPSEVMPGDSASNVGPDRKARTADDGIKQWLTRLKINESASEITLKGEATSEHNDELQQGSNSSDISLERLPSLPGSPDAAKAGNSSAEQDSLNRALIALSRTKILQNQSSMMAFLQDLVSNGVNLNAQDEDGLTAMHWASREGHLAFVKFLCERGADINLRSNDGQSALNEAIAAGHSSSANFVLKHKAADIEQCGRYGQTPLICAARHGHLIILNLLLKCNADLDAKSVQGNTALHLAVSYDHGDSVDHLINAGAPLEAKDSDGHTALSLAASRGRSKVVELLLQAGAKTDYRGGRDDWGPPLYCAAVHGHNDCVKLLLDAGALPEAVDSDGHTALWAASYYGHKDIIEILLAAGAKIGAKGKHDRNVLFYVTQKHHDDLHKSKSDCSFCSGRETRKNIMEYLCKQGADASAIDDYGNSLLRFLAKCDLVDQDEKKAIKKILKRFGAK